MLYLKMDSTPHGKNPLLVKAPASVITPSPKPFKKRRGMVELSQRASAVSESLAEREGLKRS